MANWPMKIFEYFFDTQSQPAKFSPVMNKQHSKYGKGNRAAKRVQWNRGMATLRAIHAEIQGLRPRWAFGTSDDE